MEMLVGWLCVWGWGIAFWATFLGRTLDKPWLMPVGLFAAVFGTVMAVVWMYIPSTGDTVLLGGMDDDELPEAPVEVLVVKQENSVLASEIRLPRGELEGLPVEPVFAKRPVRYFEHGDLPRGL